MLNPKSAAFSAVQAPLSYPSGFIQCCMDPKISVLQLAQHLTFLLMFDSHPEKGSFSLLITAALYSGQYGNKNFFHLKQSIFTGHKETTAATKVHLYFNQQEQSARYKKLLPRNPFCLSTDYTMNYASDVPGMFIQGNVHSKMLKLLKVFKGFLFPLLQTLIYFSG